MATPSSSRGVGIKYPKSLPPLVEHEFWRDFYRSLLNGVKRGALQKIVIVALFLGIFAHGQANDAEHANVVVLLDLSQSVAVKGHDSRAEFEKNVQNVISILAALPAGRRSR